MDNIGSAAIKLSEKILGTSSDPLAEILKAIASEMGLSNIAHLRFSSASSDDVTVMTAVNTYPIEWQRTYFLKQYGKIDPVVRFGAQATAPFDWSALDRDDPAVRNFFADAGRHKVGLNGLSIPVRNRKNTHSVVSFSSNLPDQEWEAFKSSNMTSFQQLSALIDSAESVERNTLRKAPVQLTPREQQSLVWAARGRTHQEIAELMNLSLGSVKTHLDAARRKLQCKNLTHAVGVAVAAGLIPAAVLGESDLSL